MEFVNCKFENCSNFDIKTNDLDASQTRDINEEIPVILDESKLLSVLNNSARILEIYNLQNQEETCLDFKLLDLLTEDILNKGFKERISCRERLDNFIKSFPEKYQEAEIKSIIKDSQRIRDIIRFLSCRSDEIGLYDEVIENAKDGGIEIKIYTAELLRFSNKIPDEDYPSIYNISYNVELLESFGKVARFLDYFSRYAYNMQRFNEKKPYHEYIHGHLFRYEYGDDGEWHLERDECNVDDAKNAESVLEEKAGNTKGNTPNTAIEAKEIQFDWLVKQLYKHYTPFDSNKEKIKFENDEKRKEHLLNALHTASYYNGKKGHIKDIALHLSGCWKNASIAKQDVAMILEQGGFIIGNGDNRYRSFAGNL